MRVTFLPIGLTWQEMMISGDSGSMIGPRTQLRYAQILREWEGTKYKSGSSLKGESADCIGYTFGIIDELYRRQGLRIDRLPPDTSLHDPATALAALRVLRRIYQPCTEVTNGVVEPADVIITKAPKGGPGHVMLVGARRNTIWHCNVGVGVVMSGFSLPAEFAQIHSIYRFDDREKWL